MFIFFFNDPPPTEIYTLSLHDALPISASDRAGRGRDSHASLLRRSRGRCGADRGPDRKSTRLNSSHPSISYAVFCLKKKIISYIQASKTPKQITLCIPNPIVAASKMTV